MYPALQSIYALCEKDRERAHRTRDSKLYGLADAFALKQCGLLSPEWNPAFILTRTYPLPKTPL